MTNENVHTFRVELGELAASYLKRLFSAETNAEALCKCVGASLIDDTADTISASTNDDGSFTLSVPAGAFSDDYIEGDTLCTNNKPREAAVCSQIFGWVATSMNVLRYPQEYAVKVSPLPARECA